jgi:hypothetical protein
VFIGATAYKSPANAGLFPKNTKPKRLNKNENIN